MNVFIAGGSGAIGRVLVPMLVAEGHCVVAMTRSPDSAARLERVGATAVIGDVFDRARLAELISRAQPDTVIHQLTAFAATGADPLAETIRIRTEGTANLVEAAAAAGARRFIAQSISFICKPIDDGLTDEETPLYLEAPEAIRPLARAVAELERRTLECSSMEGTVLRYGWFYGPGTNFDPSDSIPRAIRKGRMPLVGDGAGTYSFIHVQDAAVATMRALARPQAGIFNIVDDEPARLSEWLPFVAGLLGAPAPTRMDERLAREKLGDMMVYVFNEQSGASNLKAKKFLDGNRPFLRGEPDSALSTRKSDARQMTTSASSRRTLMDRLLRLLPAPQPDADFTPPPQELAPDVWALDRQQRWPGGARLPLRTTIVRVRSGGLVVISPPPLFGSGACAEIDSIGVVEQVVAPNTFHYVYAAQFLSQYPRATFLVSPALPERVEGLPPAVELGPTAPESWSGVLEIEVLGPVRGVSEVVFFHVPTGSVILTDLAFNITYSGRRIDRLMWQMAGIPDGFGPGRTSRTVLLRDRSEAARCLRRVADWPIRQIIVAHGDVVAHNAKDRFVNAFALYLGAQ